MKPYLKKLKIPPNTRMKFRRLLMNDYQLELKLTESEKNKKRRYRPRKRIYLRNSRPQPKLPELSIKDQLIIKQKN